MIQRQLSRLFILAALSLPYFANAEENRLQKPVEKTPASLSFVKDSPNNTKDSSDSKQIEPQEISKLSLSSQATIRLPPDELQLKIGVVTLSDTAEKALEENGKKMQAIVAALQEIKIPRSDFETGHFAIHPNYTPYPKDAPADWQPSINGYEVSNSIFIHTSQLDTAGKLIDAANRAGANVINDIHFVLHDPHHYWDEVITSATNNAISDAEAIAKAAQVKLVRILSISLENSNVITPRFNTLYQAKTLSADPTPIEPGNVTLTASISIVYEIANEE